MRLTRTLGAGIAALAIAAIPIATMGATAAHAGPPPPGANETWSQNSNGNLIYDDAGTGRYIEDDFSDYTQFDVTYVSSGSYGYDSPYWCISDGGASSYAGDDNGAVAHGPSSCGEYEQWWLQCSGTHVTVENIAVAYNDGATALNNNQSTYPTAYVDVGGSAGANQWYIVVDGVGVWDITGECGF